MNQQCSNHKSAEVIPVSDSARDFNVMIAQLDSIYENHRRFLLLSDSIQKYGNNSTELKNLGKAKFASDKVNLEKVTKILDRYGWLGSDAFGKNGEIAVFMMIFTSNKPTLEKYWPMINEAASKGKISTMEFAQLQDKYEKVNQRPQIYGTIIQRNEDGTYALYPVLDEKNINKRRAEVGLPPIEDYLKKTQNIDYKPPVQ